MGDQLHCGDKGEIWPWDRDRHSAGRKAGKAKGGGCNGRSERELRCLIDRMVWEGYIIQTEGAYSVLRLGDITGLREAGARVMVRMPKEKKAAEGSRREKRRSTDSLTSAGYKLFEQLRKRRLVIAREAGMPPYIVFSDKTLIDMCVRLPRSKQEMLAVSGVGENKYLKYGQQFLDEIAGFVEWTEIFWNHLDRQRLQLYPMHRRYNCNLFLRAGPIEG